DLRGLGSVEGQSISGLDVTSQFVDLNARLRTWEAQEAVLLRLIRRATSIESALRVLDRLAEMQYRVGRVQGQVGRLGNLATVWLNLPRNVEAALRAIAEPRRRRILRLVRDAEMSAGEIASHFDVTRSAVSQHLRVLKDAGLLAERRNGTRRIYRIRPEGLAELREFIDGLWEVKLAALKRVAEAEERRGRGR